MQSNDITKTIAIRRSGLLGVKMYDNTLEESRIPILNKKHHSPYFEIWPLKYHIH